MLNAQWPISASCGTIALIRRVPEAARRRGFSKRCWVLGPADAENLRRRLLGAALESDCEPEEADEYGRRYTLDFLMETRSGRAWVRSGWIVRAGEDFPRLTTCYVLTRRNL